MYPPLSGDLRAVSVRLDKRSASRVCVFVSVYLLLSGEPEHEIVPLKWALFVSVYPPLSGDLRAVSVRPDRRWPLAGSWARPAAKAARASPWLSLIHI